MIRLLRQPERVSGIGGLSVRGRVLRRIGRRRLRRAGLPRLLLRPRRRRLLDVLGRVAPGERLVVGRMRRLELRQRPPIAVRHRRPVWRLARRQLDAGLHEHETGLIALLLLKHRQTLGLSRLGGRQPLEIRELRKDENQDDDEQVDDDRQQHAFARAQCSWHPLDIRVSILEIEVHQWFSKYNTPAFAPRDAGYRSAT